MTKMVMKKGNRYFTEFDAGFPCSTLHKGDAKVFTANEAHASIIQEVLERYGYEKEIIDTSLSATQNPTGDE